jgi:hypothetical protein
MPVLGAAAALLRSGSDAAVAFPAAPISGDRGLFVQALHLSGRDIEDDLASENVRSWGNILR